jgi:hypothetical protein
MKMDKLNKWLTLTANIGVLAGIVFLAIEINQNTESNQAQTRSDVASNHVWLWEMMLDNGIQELFDQASTNDIEPGSPDYRTFRSYSRTLFVVWENEWYQYTRGLYDDDSFRAQRERWRDVFSYPLVREVWKDTTQMHTESFVTEINSIIREFE